MSSSASQHLKHTSETIESIARELGYTSEYAFNRGARSRATAASHRAATAAWRGQPD